MGNGARMIAAKQGNVYVSTAAKYRVVGESAIAGSENSTTLCIRPIYEADIPVETPEEDVPDLLAGMIFEGDLTEEEVQAIAALYPAWEVGEDVAVDDLRSYGTTVYRVIQAHRTQADWTPDATPALWVKAVPENVIPEWVQPSGSHDSYHVGDFVTHNGWVWECTAGDASGNNSWAPGVYGWTQVEPV